MVYINQALQSVDPLFESWRAAICAQILQAASILKASTTYLKPFVDSLESGFVQTGDLRRRQDTGFGFVPGIHTQPSTSKSKTSKFRSK